jgi:hypothetical protein
LGENPALDNSQTGEYLNAPRNIGFKKMSKDLDTVLSTGAAETGGYYSFDGQWTELSNEGV